MCYTIYCQEGEQRLTVSFFKPLTLHPSGNTQVGNDCTELGKTFSKKFEKPLDKCIPLWYNKCVVKSEWSRETENYEPTRNRYRVHTVRKRKLVSPYGKKQNARLMVYNISNTPYLIAYIERGNEI